jgi:hypothetical protein
MNPGVSSHLAARGPTEIRSGVKVAIAAPKKDLSA